MRWLPGTFLCCLAGVLASSDDQAAEPTPQNKLIGTWEVTKSESDWPVGAILEFTRDGKLKVTTRNSGKELMTESLYTRDGEKLTTTGAKGDKESLRIVKLTDFELVTEGGIGKGVVIGYSFKSDAKMKTVRPAKPLRGGQAKFELVVGGKTFPLEAGKTFWFPNEGFKDGVDAFIIRGINPSEKLDPEDNMAFPTGISWMQAGAHEITMAPILQRPLTEYKRK